MNSLKQFALPFEIPRRNNPLIDIELGCNLSSIYNLIGEVYRHHMTIALFIGKPD